MARCGWPALRSWRSSSWLKGAGPQMHPPRPARRGGTRGRRRRKRRKLLFHVSAGPSCQTSWTRFSVLALVVDPGNCSCHAGYACIAPRAVFLSVVCKPEMLGIMAVSDQKDSYALFPGSGMYKAGYCLYFTPRVVSLHWLAGP